jgi:hypothetical protein
MNFVAFATIAFATTVALPRASSTTPDAQATAQHQASLDSFKRAFSAYMDARGYSVK